MYWLLTGQLCSCRGKCGAFEDSLYVCYPNGSLGLQGVEATTRSVKDPPKKKVKLKPNSDSSCASAATGLDSTKIKLEEINDNTTEYLPVIGRTRTVQLNYSHLEWYIVNASHTYTLLKDMTIPLPISESNNT